MDKFNETTIFTSSEDNVLEKYQVPEPLDTWCLEDFEDVFE